MTNIDSDQHSPQIGHCFRELHSVQVTAHLAIELPKDVGSLR